MRRVVAVAATLVIALGPSAGAHETDPAIVTVLDSVTPTLPAGVRIAVASSVAAQLVVENTTSTPLEALSDTGEVFLRVSSAGVAANLGSRAWYDSNLPSGRAAVPAASIGGPRFARVQVAPSWGWFDHRLHPSDVRVTAEVRAAKGRSRLAEWTVPLRYGATPVTLRGHLEFRPVLGRLVTAVTSTGLPAGLEVRTVDGRLPAVFLRNSTGRSVRVLGPDEELFALLDDDRVMVNRQSRVHIEDQRGRGQLPTLAPAGGGLLVVGTSTTYTWLDLRLRHTQPEVPDDVARRRRPTVLVRWTIPIDVSGERTVVTGTTSFVPFASGSSGGRTGTPFDRRVLLLLIPAVVLLAGALRRRATSMGKKKGIS